MCRQLREAVEVEKFEALTDSFVSVWPWGTVAVQKVKELFYRVHMSPLAKAIAIANI